MCGESKTIQEPTELVDINEIIKRATKTGFLVDPSKAPTRQPQFGDFTGADYMESQNRIAEIKGVFDGLTSDVREMFNNDPTEFLDAIADPELAVELKEFGIITPHLEEEEKKLQEEETARKLADAQQVTEKTETPNEGAESAL